MSGSSRFRSILAPIPATLLAAAVWWVGLVLPFQTRAQTEARAQARTPAQTGGLDLRIRRPAPDSVVPATQRRITVEGWASVVGGLRKLDLFLVLDSSKSLRRSDPEDRRAAGAIGLVRFLLWSDVHLGVVDFDRSGEVVTPLTGDRSAVMEAIRSLDQDGRTDLAGGIRAALRGFEQGGRPGAARAMLVFTDGRSESEAARAAMEEAREQGVAIHTLLLGSDEEGATILRELALGTGGHFLAVSDAKELSNAFLDLRTLGLAGVWLSVNGAEPIPARVVGRDFSAEVPLAPGENRIVARARSEDGREQEDVLHVTVRSPGCAELQVRAERDGRPALSISSRAVEIVVDASGSMWKRMGGRTRIAIAKQILDDALDWLPRDLELSLRAYGHRHDRRAHDCEDTRLLVSPGTGNRSEIRRAIAALEPRGQTPLGYALAQVPADFGDFEGERAVVLVTDGVESCGGDAPSAARSLQATGPVPVHVIGFGLDARGDDDLAGLRAIAHASGGRFLTAGSADELRQALGTTLGTPFRVWRGDEPVAEGVLGADERIRLPAGAYRVRLESVPPEEVSLELASEERVAVVLRREAAGVVHTLERAPIEYAACAAPATEGPAADPRAAGRDAGSPGPALPAAPSP